MTRRTAPRLGPRPDRTVSIPLPDCQALLRAGIDPVTLFCPETPRERRIKARRRWLGVASLAAVAVELAFVTLQIAGFALR